MPSFQSILVIYLVLVLFGLYILYMYEPLSAHFLFSRLFWPIRLSGAPSRQSCWELRSRLRRC